MRAGSLAENIGAIVSGEAKPHGVVTYVMAGVTVLLLLATTTWATVLIRCIPALSETHFAVVRGVCSWCAFCVHQERDLIKQSNKTPCRQLAVHALARATLGLGTRHISIIG